MKSVPRPVLLLILSFLCPTELSLYLGDLRLPPHRVAIILLLPLAMYRILTRGDIRVRPFDFLFVAYGVWTVWVYGQTEGSAGTIYGGSLALESLGAFFIARAWVRDEGTMRATLYAMMIAITLAAMIALPETLFGQIFMHDFLAKMTGYVHPTAVEYRAMGLARAYGTFDHPIHYGTFCAALFASFWYAEPKIASRVMRASFFAGATMLGLSSAPLLCIGLQTGMLTWERITRGINMRTPITVAIIVGLYIGAATISNRGPINLIATGMTFDAWTGFYRLQIWENGMNNVWANPLFGIGLQEWDRPTWMVSSTIDAFWLVTAMRAGIPAFLLLMAAIIVLGRGVVTRGIRSRVITIKQLGTGWMMSLIALCLIATTVHYWNVLNSFFFFFLGLGGWLADPKKQAAVVAKVKAARQRIIGQPALPQPPPIPGYAYPSPGYGYGGFAGQPT